MSTDAAAAPSLPRDRSRRGAAHDDDETIVCYVPGANGAVGGRDVPWTRQLWRDAKLCAATFALTCLFVVCYNLRLHRQLKSKQGKKKKGGGLATTVSGRKTIKWKTSSVADDPAASLAAKLAHVEGMDASGNFLSGVFAQIWEQAAVAVPNLIKETLEPTLKDMKVPIHFIKMDLGSVPIKITNMFIHRGEKEDGKGRTHRVAQIDMDVEWDGECDVMLQATMSKSAKVTFGVRSIKLSGRMHILLGPLTTEMPIVSAVQYGFINPPDIRLEFTGAVKTLASLDFVQSAVVGVINSSLASMLVLPYRMVMPLDLGGYDYLDTYKPPVGVVRLTAVSGRGFKILHKYILKDIPDIYCKIHLGSKDGCGTPAFRTKTKYDNLDPNWEDEHGDFILYDMDQKVYLEVFDEDKGPLDPDDLLGTAEVSVRDLFRNDGVMELELELQGAATGCFATVSAELLHLSQQLGSLHAPEYEGKGQLCGLATIIITRAFDLPIPRVDAATYVKVVYGEGSEHEKTFFTGAVVDYPGVDALNPMYDCVFHVPITAAMLKSHESMMNTTSSSISSIKSSVTRRRSISRSLSAKKELNRNNIAFILVDGDGANGTAGHGELGRMSVTHESLLNAYKHTITETRPIGDGGAKLEFQVKLSGIQSETEKLQWGAAQDADLPQSIFSETMAKKVNIRVTCLRGRGFSIRKRTAQKDDVPDVYCTICLAHTEGELSLSPPWKTKTVKDDTMPKWGETREFADTNPAEQVLRVDAYDQNKKGEDEWYGRAEFSLEHILRKRVLEMELMDGAKGASSYVTLQCVQLSATEHKPGAAAGIDNGVAAKKVGFVTENNVTDVEDQEEYGDVVAPLTVTFDRHPSCNSPQNKDDGSVSSLSSTNSMSKRLSKVGKMGKSVRSRMSFKKSSKRNNDS